LGFINYFGLFFTSLSWFNDPNHVFGQLTLLTFYDLSYFNLIIQFVDLTGYPELT
jgi:hypothetical protein